MTSWKLLLLIFSCCLSGVHVSIKSHNSSSLLSSLRRSMTKAWEDSGSVNIENMFSNYWSKFCMALISACVFKRWSPISLRNFMKLSRRPQLFFKFTWLVTKMIAFVTSREEVSSDSSKLNSCARAAYNFSRSTSNDLTSQSAKNSSLVYSIILFCCRLIVIDARL